MKLYGQYLLRKNTRPSTEEATFLLGRCLIELGVDVKALNALEALSLTFHVSNLPFETEKTVSEYMNAFIATTGGKIFIEKPDKYVIHCLEFDSGDPPEPSCAAFVFSNEDAINKDSDAKAIAMFIERGKRWEEIGHIGDAIHCYSIALEIYPDTHEILYRLGSLMMKDNAECSGIYLRKAFDFHQNQPEYLVALARHYCEMSSGSVICVVVDQDMQPIQVGSKEWQHRALTLYERAFRLDLSKPEIKADLEQLRTTMNISASFSFFK